MKKEKPDWIVKKESALKMKAAILSAMPLGEKMDVHQIKERVAASGIGIRHIIPIMTAMAKKGYVIKSRPNIGSHPNLYTRVFK